MNREDQPFFVIYIWNWLAPSPAPILVLKVVKLSAERQAEKSHKASWHQAYILANSSWKIDTRRECRKGMQRNDMQAVIIHRQAVIRQAGCHRKGRLS